MDTNQYLIEYYNRGMEDGRLASQHGSVEFLTTMRYLERYLRPGDRIIEIGAGTGRYSHALARQGYTVDSVELIQYNIDIFRQNTQQGEKVTITQGNALDLTEFGDEKFNITLLLGPMYHLFTTEDKQQALREAIRVTKPGGIVFVAYTIADTSILEGGFRNNRFSVAEFIVDGLIDPETFITRSEPKYLFELVRKENIDELMTGFNVTRLHYVAADGYTNHMKEAIDNMDKATFNNLCEKSPASIGGEMNRTLCSPVN